MKFITFTAVILFSVLLECTQSQENLPSADEVVKGINNVVDIPELKNFNTSALPNVEEVKNLFKEKCMKNGGPTAFDDAEKAQVEMTQCVQSLINITELQAEMERYKPTGDLDIVFKNYCNKRPILRNCVQSFTDVIEHCLDEKERENKKFILNITDTMLGFVCFKEGDRIALFIAAGGPECIQERQQAIQDCANITFSSYLPKPEPSSNSLIGLESLPSLAFGLSECRNISSFQKCIVAELEKCDDPTPANIVDSIFDFIKRETPCANLLAAHAAAVTGEQPSDASHILGTLSTVAILFTIASYSSSFIITV